jgi:molecular chaperone DnaK
MYYIGIDLGTTNSEIAFINENGDIEVIDNNEGAKYTPSVVHIDENGQISVGEWAKNFLKSDSKNVDLEFKREMGDRTYKFRFETTGKEMSAIELSKEVLKSILIDAERRIDKRPVIAVITVPAAFLDPQRGDTIEAGKLAGLKCVELLKEPVATCYAYSSKLSKDRRPKGIVYWFVYDLGGGTFDAALIKVEDGNFTVVEHEGDQFLGGKDIDRNIMDIYVVPEFEKKYPALKDELKVLKEGNEPPLWWILKLNAEYTKLRVSKERRPIPLDKNINYSKDGQQHMFLFQCLLDEQKVAIAMAPILYRSLVKIDEVLKKIGIEISELDRLILVGGPTLSPVLRETLKGEYEWKEELLGLIPDVERREALDRLSKGLKGVTIDHSLDPTTVVAQGAALYAASFDWPDVCIEEDSDVKIAIVKCSNISDKGVDKPSIVNKEQKSAGICAIVLKDWKKKNPVDSGWEVEVESKSMEWKTGRIAVDRNGKFTCEVSLKPERDTNIFKITVFDPKGRGFENVPGSEFNIISVPPDIKLDRDIGIGLEGYEMNVLFSKGEPIPRGGCIEREASGYKTTGELDPSNKTSAIVIPIYEGKSRNYLGNKRIGEIKVEAKDVDSKILFGSGVKIYAKVCQSGDGGKLTSMDVEFVDVLPGRKFPEKPPEDMKVVPEEFVEKLFKTDFITADCSMEKALDNIKGIGIFKEIKDLKAIKEKAWRLRLGRGITTSRTMDSFKEVREAFSKELQNLFELPRIQGLKAEVEELLIKYKKNPNDSESLQRAEERLMDIIEKLSGDIGSDVKDCCKEAEWPHKKVHTRGFIKQVNELFDRLSKMSEEEKRNGILFRLVQSYRIPLNDEENTGRLIPTVEEIIKNIPNDKRKCDDLITQTKIVLEKDDQKKVEELWEEFLNVPIVRLLLFGIWEGKEGGIIKFEGN